jgi:transposase
LIAGLLNHKVIALITYKGYTDTQVFNVCSEQCLIPVLPPNCLIVMDSASFHKSEETQEIIETNGHTLLFFPPYSPDLNPIENYWAIIKEKLRKNHSKL